MKSVAMGPAQNFQPSQIVYLEHEGKRLYAEVIQIVESRPACWVRPLMMVVSPLQNDLVPEETALYDLRQGADLLWPLSLFRPALDTEVVPILTQLQGAKTQFANHQSAHQQLNDFIHQVWQAHQSHFRV